MPRYYLTLGDDPDGPNGPIRGPNGQVVSYTSAADAGVDARKLARAEHPVFVQKLVPVALYMPVSDNESGAVVTIEEQEDTRVEN